MNHVTPLVYLQLMLQQIPQQMAGNRCHFVQMDHNIITVALNSTIGNVHQFLTIKNVWLISVMRLMKTIHTLSQLLIIVSMNLVCNRLYAIDLN